MAFVWGVYWLLREPAVLERLRAEIGALGPEPAPEALVRLAYLGAVISETNGTSVTLVGGAGNDTLSAVGGAGIVLAGLDGDNTYQITGTTADPISVSLCSAFVRAFCAGVHPAFHSCH